MSSDVIVFSNPIPAGAAAQTHSDFFLVQPVKPLPNTFSRDLAPRSTPLLGRRFPLRYSLGMTLLETRQLIRDRLGQSGSTLVCPSPKFWHLTPRK
jgi:hypothetical protein